MLKVSMTQVNSVHVNPVDSNLLLTGSNDWTARLADLRCLTSAASEPDSGKVPYFMPKFHSDRMYVYVDMLVLLLCW